MAASWRSPKGRKNGTALIHYQTYNTRSCVYDPESKRSENRVAIPLPFIPLSYAPKRGIMVIPMWRLHVTEVIFAESKQLKPK